MECIDKVGSEAPASVSSLCPPFIQRQVYLRMGRGNHAGERTKGDLLVGQNGTEFQDSDSADVVLAYAASWWNVDSAATYLRDASKPIWMSLSQGRTELYRDLQRVYLGDSVDLQKVFQNEGPFWGRDYIFWHDGKPLTVIHEVFSNALSRYLS
jgi:hypothetical protein